jgi:hypothetical protein
MRLAYDFDRSVNYIDYIGGTTLKKLFPLLILMMAISLLFAGSVYASEGTPVGSCPTGYTLEMFMDHSDPHMHHHIGITEDLNADGFICMRIVSQDLHLHVDNSLPLP